MAPISAKQEEAFKQIKYNSGIGISEDNYEAGTYTMRIWNNVIEADKLIALEMLIETNVNIINVGFVSDRDKYDEGFVWLKLEV